VTAHARELTDTDEATLREVIDDFDADEARAAAARAIRDGELERSD
jgi:4-phosphopantoate--beta-alanine ligase